MTSATFAPLSEADLAELSALESWVAGHYDDAQRDQYAETSGKLHVIQTILDQGWIETSDPQVTVKRQALGATFGQVLAEMRELEWCVVTDENGRNLALRDPGTSIRLFPLTMISRRLERGEAVDVFELLRSALTALRDARADAD